MSRNCLHFETVDTSYYETNHQNQAPYECINVGTVDTSQYIHQQYKELKKSISNCGGWPAVSSKETCDRNNARNNAPPGRHLDQCQGWRVLEPIRLVLEPFMGPRRTLEGPKYVTGRLVIPTIPEFRRVLHEAIREVPGVCLVSDGEDDDRAWCDAYGRR